MGLNTEGCINVTMHKIIVLNMDHLEPIALGKAPPIDWETAQTNPILPEWQPTRADPDPESHQTKPILDLLYS